jgi:putative transposase
MAAVDRVLEQNSNMECAGLPAPYSTKLASAINSSGASSAEQSGSKLPHSKDKWHHRPVHVFEPNQLYMVTASTLHKQFLFKDDDQLDMLQRHLFTLSEKFGWELQAWSIFPNHYHFIAKAPEDAETLKVLIRQLHSLTARELNKIDNMAGRKVWFQYWDTCLTYEKSYYARLNYVMNNPVHHGVASVASNYRFCSAGWFELNADAEFVKKVKTFKYDQVEVPDEF